MPRRPLIAGNWKLNKTCAEAAALAQAIDVGVRQLQPRSEVAVAPVYTALSTVRTALADGPVALAAQELYPEDAGAFTGAVSGPLLREVGCQYVLVGHSERRQRFGETLASSQARLQAALRAGLVPILCVGESLAEREAERTQEVVQAQLQGALAGVSAAQLQQLVIAYEPVWAIGTGKVATPEQAQQVHAHIRALLEPLGLAAAVRLLYGGSVNADNAARLLQQTDVDGALVGGASLDAKGFLGIVAAAG